MIKGSNINKSYNGKRVLTDISLNAESGHIYALLGANGSGKSTLLRCLAQLEDIDSGQIDFFGQYINPEIATNRNIWPDLTIVFQHLFLWPHLTVEQNIALPLKYRFPDVYKDLLNNTIKKFQLEEIKKRYPNQISGGQKQKVAIARAVTLKPRILLLDEITSSLDNHQAAYMAKLLADIKDEGTLLILVTHSINFAINCATDFWVLEEGKIAESGPIEEIQYPKSAFLKAALTPKGYLI